MRIQAEIIVIITSIEYVSIFRIWTKPQRVVVYTCELTFCYKCVNNILVMRDWSEVV